MDRRRAVLVITGAGDMAADAVVAHLRAGDALVVRTDTGDFPNG